MQTIHGLLLLLGDFLLKIPIIVWIVAFVGLCVWIVKSEFENVKIATAFTMIFYFVLINYLDISSSFIGTAGLGVIIPIIIMVSVPYIATLLTFSILAMITKNNE